MGPSANDVAEMFAYHPPKDESVANKHQQVRSICFEAAITFLDIIPESPERTHAINKLREAMFWANAAIAVHS